MIVRPNRPAYVVLVATSRGEVIGAPLTFTHKLPRAEFDMEGRDWRRAVTQNLEQRLSLRVGPIRVIQTLFIPTIIVTLDRVDFVVGISRLRGKNGNRNARHVAVDPLYPAALNASVEERSRQEKDLLLISNEVHLVLSTLPGITRLRWYFQGWSREHRGLRSPAELPWQAEISAAEVSHADHRRHRLPGMSRKIAVLLGALAYSLLPLLFYSTEIGAHALTIRDWGLLSAELAVLQIALWFAVRRCAYVGLQFWEGVGLAAGYMESGRSYFDVPLGALGVFCFLIISDVIACTPWPQNLYYRLLRKLYAHSFCQ